MRGRSRGHQERAVILAHQIETMARQKTLKPIKHYLPKPSKKKKKTEGASMVLAMFQRMKKRQGTD
jgi:hypothetical protein